MRDPTSKPASGSMAVLRPGRVLGKASPVLEFRVQAARVEAPDVLLPTRPAHVPPPPTVEPRAPQGAPTLGRSADPGTPATVPIVVAAPDGDRWLVDARTTRMPELRRRRVWPYALMVGCVLVALASWRGALPVGGLAATLAGALAAGAQR